jgi:hypothetical protein
VPAGNIIAVLRKQEHADKIAKNLGVDTVVGDIGDSLFIEKIVLEKDGKLPHPCLLLSGERKPSKADKKQSMS